MKELFQKLFGHPELEITIWDSANTKIFILRSVTQITNTSITGKDSKGLRFEYNSLEPFNYQIKKIR